MILQEKTYLENVALQLSESIAELHRNNTKTYELIKAVLFGMYSQGYRDANLERERGSFKMSMHEVKDSWEDLKHKFK
jgi:hypothetical protein